MDKKSTFKGEQQDISKGNYTRHFVFTVLHKTKINRGVNVMTKASGCNNNNNI